MTQSIDVLGQLWHPPSQPPPPPPTSYRPKALLPPHLVTAPSEPIPYASLCAWRVVTWVRHLWHRHGALNIDDTELLPSTITAAWIPPLSSRAQVDITVVRNSRSADCCRSTLRGSKDAKCVPSMTVHACEVRCYSKSIPWRLHES